jgi:hypothetical protein
MRFYIDRLGGFEFGYSRESVHKGESLVAGAVVDNLINERHWKVVLGTCVIEIVKVCAHADSALFFVDGYRVGNP